MSEIAHAGEPTSKNGLSIKPNPTSEVTGLCYHLNEKAYSQLIHATCYSELNKAVVVLVSGNAEGMSGKQVAEHITSKFEEAYVPAVGFLDMTDMQGVSIIFLLNGTYYGPHSGKDWKEGFEKLKKHSAQAWYQQTD